MECLLVVLRENCTANAEEVYKRNAEFAAEMGPR